MQHMPSHNELERDKWARLFLWICKYDFRMQMLQCYNIQCLYQSLRESFLDMRNWSSSSAIIFRPLIGQSSLCWLLIGQHWYRIRVQQSLHLHFYFSSRAPLCFVSDATKQCTLGNQTDIEEIVTTTGDYRGWVLFTMALCDSQEGNL